MLQSDAKTHKAANVGDPAAAVAKIPTIRSVVLKDTLIFSFKCEIVCQFSESHLRPQISDPMPKMIAPNNRPIF